ncbi:MAG TPA: sporulation protein YabP [Candidatus Pullichristensenella excrementigallinarum]|uniref:Sporulation protein YabP n=1 Tax=Candidatus Pullichristensenella excrementigallinarum TaxID=2840907 RepID=A0A9D1ICB2_9FIRM|nr:sporulation protein YabP [Candidatus Pullichristensenella excrementigallinarum]
MQEAPQVRHSLILEGRQKATITGVSDVDCFNEQIVVLITSAGSMTLSGEGLHVENLNLKEGKLEVEGEISSIEYSGSPREKKGGVLGRLFR